MSDFAFLDRDKSVDPAVERRQHRERVLRECFAHQAKFMQNDAEHCTDYCRDMIRAGYEARDELHELETFARGLLLCVLLLKREAGKTE